MNGKRYHFGVSLFYKIKFRLNFFNKEKSTEFNFFDSLRVLPTQRSACKSKPNKMTHTKAKNGQINFTLKMPDASIIEEKKNMMNKTKILSKETKRHIEKHRRI